MQRANSEAYLRFAGDCLRKANHERDPGKRGLFILIATAWAELAERAKAPPPSGIPGQDRQPANTLH